MKNQLRLLGDLPHPDGSVPAPRGDAALTAQAVQACDGILVPEAGSSQQNSHSSDKSRCEYNNVK